MEIYENLTLDEERALYGQEDISVVNCTFDGPRDGESALKECKNITVKDSRFLLRYPLWHITGGLLERVFTSEECRAALWYAENITIRDSHLNGIKAVRECADVTIENSKIKSAEFGWMSDNLAMNNSEVESEYPFLHSSNLAFSHFTLRGKYSFQYSSDVTIDNSYLDTKDAFWHSENVTVKDSVIKGEYLGWYSNNLTLVRCRIIGTQPLCYAKNLVLEDCEMIDCDLSFEKSDVRAVVKGRIDSVKNPHSGYIYADEIGGIISDSIADAGAPCIIKTGESLKDECCC